jgi:hypothetical protein
MRDDKEIIWLVKLLNSNFYNSFFKKNGGSISNFEKCANNSLRNEEFRNWFKKMNQKEIIKFLELRENRAGSPTKIYVIDKNKCWKYLKEFELFNVIRKVISDNSNITDEFSY